MLRDDIAERLKNRQQQNSTAAITKTERSDLLKIAKLREKVSKTGLDEAGARLLVDLDSQLDTSYSFDSDEIWQQAHDLAKKAIEDAQATVVARCRELGIPDRFGPRISGGYWISQGEQALRERRN